MEPTTPICQSCGMPMTQPDDFGTTADGTPNQDYCTYCFQNGAFTLPNLTLAEMTERLLAMHNEIGMTEEQVQKLTTKFLPSLKRWAN